jgi:hypothetical protein
MSYVHPDKITRVPINGGELLLSEGYDILHFFQPLGVFMLKYWDQDGRGISNVMIDEENGFRLSEMTGTLIVPRPSIMRSEHEMIVQWRSDNLDDADFGL